MGAYHGATHAWTSSDLLFMFLTPVPIPTPAGAVLILDDIDLLMHPLRSDPCPQSAVGSLVMLNLHPRLKWRFLEIGVPLVIIHLNMIFPNTNHPAMGDLSFMESPKCCGMCSEARAHRLTDPGEPHATPGGLDPRKNHWINMDQK